MNVGGEYYKQHNFTQAIADYTKILEIDPENTLAYTLRGVTYYALSNFTQAIAEYSKAIERTKPKDVLGIAGVYYYRGVAYSVQHNFVQAITDFTKTIKIDAQFVLVNKDSLYIRYDPNHSFQAISAYTKAIAINPKDVKVYYARGLTYELEENFEQAIADFTKAIAINPKYAEAYYGRGIAYFYSSGHDYDKTWEDMHTAKVLGITLDPYFIAELKRASGREKYGLIPEAEE